MKVKVLLSRSASNRYRFPQFAPDLLKRGMNVELFNVGHSSLEFVRILSKVKEADIVVILRKLFPPWKLRFIRRYAKKLIFEYDDAIMYRSSRWAQQYSGTRQERFEKMVKASDLIIAGNRFLQEEALKYIDPIKVHIIPTVVDMGKYVVKQDNPAKDTLIVGWIGSQSTLHYLKALLPVFEELGRRFPFLQLKIVCNAFFDVPTMRVIKKEWSEADEVADLQSFDIGLGPLPDDVWTRGKCGFKLIQCLAVGVPVVCSPVGANKEIVREGEEGFWARDKEEWVDRLSVLIRDRQLRKRMGKQGRKRIEKDYSLQAMAPQLAKVLINI